METRKESKCILYKQGFFSFIPSCNKKNTGGACEQCTMKKLDALFFDCPGVKVYTPENKRKGVILINNISTDYFKGEEPIRVPRMTGGGDGISGIGFGRVRPIESLVRLNTQGTVLLGVFLLKSLKQRLCLQELNGHGQTVERVTRTLAMASVPAYIGMLKELLLVLNS